MHDLSRTSTVNFTSGARNSVRACYRACLIVRPVYVFGCVCACLCVCACMCVFSCVGACMSIRKNPTLLQIKMTFERNVLHTCSNHQIYLATKSSTKTTAQLNCFVEVYQSTIICLQHDTVSTLYKIINHKDTTKKTTYFRIVSV